VLLPPPYICLFLSISLPSLSLMQGMEGEGWDLCRFCFSLLSLSFPLDLSPPCLGEADQVAAAVAARGWGSFQFRFFLLSMSLPLSIWISSHSHCSHLSRWRGRRLQGTQEGGCQPMRVSAAAITAMISIPSRSMPPQ
jgi:hypothetical protein